VAGTHFEDYGHRQWYAEVDLLSEGSTNHSGTKWTFRPLINISFTGYAAQSYGIDNGWNCRIGQPTSRLIGQ